MSTLRSIQEITNDLKIAKEKVLNLEKELTVVKLNQDIHTTVSFYTDGSCLDGNTAQHNPRAGWGVVGIKVLEDNNNVTTTDTLCKLKGAVITDKNHDDYIGADKFSNNTAELSAIYNALDYIVNKFQDPTQTITIYYDSTYAAKSVMGIYNGSKNRELITTCRKKLRECNNRVKIIFKYIKAHSGHKYNDMADSLAKNGAKMCTQNKRRKVGDN
jgi:ribonuclease HI